MVNTYTKRLRKILLSLSFYAKFSNKTHSSLTFYKKIWKTINCVLWRRLTHTACCIAACVCQNNKENMTRPSSSSSHQNFITMLHDYTTINKCLASFFFFTTMAFIFTFCVVMPQRSETGVCVTCIVHVTAMTLRIFLLFI